jgi:heterodisulfide reductase subunit B
MKYAYYPGCSLKGTAIDYHISTLALSERLGIQLTELEDWICCGASPIHQRNAVLTASVANFIFSLAEGMESQIAVLCAACYNNMRKAEEEIRKNPSMRTKVEKVSGTSFNPGIHTRHFLDILLNDYGLEKIQSKVCKPLTGLRVACYYGCLLSRPPSVAFDDPEEPTFMEKILEIAGARTVWWTHRLECCGASNAVPVTSSVLRLVNDILQSAEDAHADVIACACPMCQANLDMRQGAIQTASGRDRRIPIVYFTQLLGLSCGATGEEVMINKGLVNAEPVLKAKGILPGGQKVNVEILGEDPSKGQRKGAAEIRSQ